MQKNIKNSVTKLVNNVEGGIKTIEKTVETATEPVKKSLLQRFPILFSLLVTFGAVSVFFGFERVLAGIPFLYDRPWIMLTVGIGVLVGTGTLYKKLD